MVHASSVENVGLVVLKVEVEHYVAKERKCF